MTVRASCLHHSVKNSVFTNIQTTAKLTNFMWNFYLCWLVGPILKTTNLRLSDMNSTHIGLQFSFYWQNWDFLIFFILIRRHDQEKLTANLGFALWITFRVVRWVFISMTETLGFQALAIPIKTMLTKKLWYQGYICFITHDHEGQLFRFNFN